MHLKYGRSATYLYFTEQPISNVISSREDIAGIYYLYGYIYTVVE